MSPGRRELLPGPFLVEIEVLQWLPLPERLHRSLRLTPGLTEIFVLVPIPGGLSLRLLNDMIAHRLSARIPIPRILNNPRICDRDALFAKLAAKAEDLLACPRGLLRPHGSIEIPESVFRLPVGQKFELLRVRHESHYRLRLFPHPG